MLNAIKSVRNQPLPTLISSPLQSQLGRRISGVSFRAAAAEPNQPEKVDDMAEKPENPNSKPRGDLMADSYGDGYATRSNEEGFGGVYGGNESIHDSKDNEKNNIHKNHPEGYDKKPSDGEGKGAKQEDCRSMN